MKHRTTRREFLRRSSLAGFGLWLGAGVAPAWAKSPNEKLHLGVVGVGGRGAANLAEVSGESVVALCDIDERQLDAAAQRHPRARRYVDFRKMLDEKDIEAVVVSTPDHTHAVVTVAALRSGRHVYCEKPLTHDVYEAHVVAATAKKHRRATQMGTQIHAGDNYRRVVELVQTGAIGAVREAHAWVGKSWSEGKRPEKREAIPENIHYDLWLGPAPERPYSKMYLPANWRSWWDFGGGTLADMGCHYMDLIHWALDLWNPIAVETEGPPVDPETAAPWLIVKYHHPARGSLPPVEVTWYDGGKRPRHFAEGKVPQWGDGVLFVGEKGMLLAGYGDHRLLPEAEFKDFPRPPHYIPSSVGHHREWIEASKTGAPTTCNFNYSGALTETVLLGVAAYRSATSFRWDRAALRTDSEAANRFLRRPYREGWSLES